MAVEQVDDGLQCTGCVRRLRQQQRRLEIGCHQFVDIRRCNAADGGGEIAGSIVDQRLHRAVMRRYARQQRLAGGLVAQVGREHRRTAGPAGEQLGA